MSATSLGVIATTQHEWLSDQVIDSFFNGSDCDQMIYKSRAASRVDGGDKVVWAPTINRVGTPTFIASGGTFALGSNEITQQAELDWKQCGLATQRHRGDFDVFNKGRARVINLSSAVLDNLKNSVRERKCQALWDNRTSVDSAEITQSFVSLATAIDDNTSTANPSYAGIARATGRWASYKRNLAGAEVTISDIASAINELRARRKGKPTMIVVGFARYEALQREAQGAVRHPNVGAGKTELGVDTFTILGVPVCLDSYLDESAASADPAVTGDADDPRGYPGSRKVYILSTDDIAYVPQPAGNLGGNWMTVDGVMRMSEWVDLATITNPPTDLYQTLMYFYGVLAVVNIRTQAVFINVGA